MGKTRLGLVLNTNLFSYVTAELCISYLLHIFVFVTLGADTLIFTSTLTDLSDKFKKKMLVLRF